MRNMEMDRLSSRLRIQLHIFLVNEGQFGRRAVKKKGRPHEYQC